MNLNDFVKNLSVKNKKSEEPREKALRLVNRINFIKKEKRRLIQKLDQEYKELREELMEMCEGKSGSHFGCFSISETKYSISKIGNESLPSEIPEWLKVTEYHVLNTWSEKKINENN